MVKAKSWICYETLDLFTDNENETLYSKTNRKKRVLILDCVLISWTQHLPLSLYDNQYLIPFKVVNYDTY